jgi:mannuronan 5-epimerase
MAEQGGGTRRNEYTRWLATVIAIGLCMGSAVGAETAYERLTRNQPSLAPAALLDGLTGALRNGPSQPATQMIAAAGLADLVQLRTFGELTTPDWAARPSDALQAQAMNLRLALTMLTQAYGAEDVSDVLDAQSSPDQRALVIREGTATLPDLRRMLMETGLQKADATGPLTLTVPLVIWSGAALHLEKTDTLNLSRAHGAFLMNFGLLQVDGAQIAGTGEMNATSPVYMPFLTTADGGIIQASHARFAGLGFGRTQKFSGFAIMQGTIRTPAQPSWVSDSVFDSVMTVSISLAHDVVLRGNHFSNMRGAALKVSRSIGAQVLLNLFSGQMRTNAIIVEDGSAKAMIKGNVVLAGKRTGIVVRADSPDATVSHNVVYERIGGGIALITSDCGVVSENLVIGNGQKGIEVRSSDEAAITKNMIYDNHSAGLWISAQDNNAVTFMRGNLLAENGAGVSAAAGAAILMEDNDFSHQFQQFLSGDLATQTAHLARDMRGAAAIVLTAGGLQVPTQLVAACND